MPRINEHTFELDNHEYKLTYYRNDKPILYRNAVLFSGNKSALLLEYIKKNKFPLNLFKGQTTQQLSDLVLKHFSEGNNIVFVDKKLSNQSESTKVNNAKKEKYSPLTNSKDNSTADEKINELLKSLDWKKIKENNRNKLLIISCSDSKIPGGKNTNVKDYFKEEKFINLLNNREQRCGDYEILLKNNPDYFLKEGKSRKRNGDSVQSDYFSQCRTSDLFLPAIDRYDGRYYTSALRKLYRDKTNLHILIISALYGVIKFDDSIIDYHLTIERKPFWTKNNNTSICDAVKKYIIDNKIDDEMVFYSLSQGGNYPYRDALNPIKEWNNIWVIHDQGDTSVRFLRDHFLPEL
jgi:hypothetical protein